MMTQPLPTLVAPKSERPSGRHGSGPRRLPDTGAHSRPRVLIVEDEENTRDMYAWALRAAGWLVEAVGDGQQAVRVAPDFEPDVIVMDLRLPVIGGVEATRRLKADVRTGHIPIVGCSGMDRVQAEVLATRAGCDAFVAKPCPPEDLRALVERLLSGREGS